MSDYQSFFLGVHVSFLMIDHVQNRSVFLIAAKYIHICALVTYILFPQSCTNHFELLVALPFSAPVSEFSELSSVFSPDQS